MSGNGAETGMVPTAAPLRLIQKDRLLAPTVWTVGVVGAAAPGSAVFPCVAATLLAADSTTSVCAFVFSSSFNHDLTPASQKNIKHATD